MSPLMFSSKSPFSFLIGIWHLPVELMVPLNINLDFQILLIDVLGYFLKKRPSNFILHSKSSVLSVNNLYIIYLFLNLFLILP
jgi:hypothetical protein